MEAAEEEEETASQNASAPVASHNAAGILNSQNQIGSQHASGCEPGTLPNDGVTNNAEDEKNDISSQEIESCNANGMFIHFFVLKLSLIAREYQNRIQSLN